MPKFGISEIIETTAVTTADIYAAANSLAGRVDAIWIATDSTAVSSFGSMVKVVEQNKIPLFGSDVSMAEMGYAEMGAIATVGFSYYDLGVEAGKTAARVLRGENPANIPVVKANLTDLYVNASAANRMGITIPKSVMNRATKTLK